MRPEVEHFLAQSQQKKQKLLEKQMQEEQIREQKIRDYNLQKAGLYSVNVVEISEEDYKNEESYNDEYFRQNYFCKQDRHGRYHFYEKKSIKVLDVTDEEYEAVVQALNEMGEDTTGKELAEQRKTAHKEENAAYAKEYVKQKAEEMKTWASTFFVILAWITWIGGFIFSLVQGLVSKRYGTEFDFNIFLTTFVIYFFVGCFSLCMSELFKKLQGIYRELKKLNAKK